MGHACAVARVATDHMRVIQERVEDADLLVREPACQPSGDADVEAAEANVLLRLPQEQRQQVEYLLPPQTFKIENPVAVVNTSTDKPAARAFVDFLFTPQAQTLWAQAGFRPVIPEVVAQTTALFPGQIDKLWTIAELGKVLGEGTAAENDGKDLTGWKAIDTALFGSKGAVTKIYNAGGRK